MKNTNVKKSRKHTTSSGARSKAARANAAEQAARAAVNEAKRREQIAAAVAAVEAGTATLGQLRLITAHAPAVLDERPGLRPRLEADARRRSLAATYRTRAAKVRAKPVLDLVTPGAKRAWAAYYAR